MKLTTIAWVTLSALGFLAGIQFSALFFGFFTLGLFLIAREFLLRKGKPPSRYPEEPAFCQNCGAALGPGVAFCSRCGVEVKRVA